MLGNIGKTMYLRHERVKIKVIWCPKNGDIFDMLKSQYYAFRKYWKKQVLKTWPRQNHPTMMPKNNKIYDFYLIHTTLMAKNIEKNMYFRRD